VSDDKVGQGSDPVEPVDEAVRAVAGPSPTGAHPVLVYTLKRFALLVVVGALLYLVGVRDVWLILFAFLISGVISAVVLSRSREGAAYGITTAISRVNARIDESARAEDVDDLDADGQVLDPPDATEDRPA
jgi:hypothetical protein